METLKEIKDYVSTSEDKIFYGHFVDAVKSVAPSPGELEILADCIRKRIDSLHQDAIEDGQITWMHLASQIPLVANLALAESYLRYVQKERKR
ncbi:hypothetical protein A3K73_01040 [Candidatus Pacearchaeota archaeon RBG_13_36_9]|nr:MAG: hypothetical protein A3K73_01040 [Candidatus Pacearchaeota archaeon RBG_13_36_9]